MEKSQNYIADLKKHVKEKLFGFNENPLEDETVKETIYYLDITKIYIKGFYALYRAVIKENLSELSMIDQTVMPLDRCSK